MLVVLGGQVSCLLVVAPLSAHRDSCVKVKLEITRGLDEPLELLYVLQLCIAVQKKGRMVRSCFVVFVQLLQVLD